MKLSCSRGELHDALRAVRGVVDPRSVKPELRDICIRVGDGGLQILATDLEVGIKYFVNDVTVGEKGGLVVPVATLDGIVSESREERLNLATDGNTLVVEGQGSTFRVLGLPEDEFPDIPDFPEEKTLEVEGAVLAEMFNKTIFAVAHERQRYALDGSLLVATEKSQRIEMVGTDGRRLALIKRKANTPSPLKAWAIIPAKALREVEKIVGDEEIVRIYVDERRVLFKMENAVVVAQLVEGRYPEYKEAIPDDLDKRLEADKEELIRAIRQAATLTAKESRCINLHMEAGKVVMDSSDPEAGEAHVELDGKYEGDPIEIRFDPDFLLDGINAVDEDTIRLEVKDPARAGIMRTASGYLYLIMPITQ